MRFEFATARRIVFGAGTLQELPALANDNLANGDLANGDLANGLGRRPLLVRGGSAERAQPLLALLHECGLETVIYSVPHEPDVETIEAGVTLARAEKCDSVIGFGGGAVLDAAKAIAIMMTNPGELLDYLEIIGRGKALTKAPVPLIAIPTTAGTGSEVTRNSVIISPEHRAKVSLRSPLMLPKVALVDPELTYNLPPALTATTGLDALTQLIEPFVSTRANPLTDGICREGIKRAARSLRRAYAAARLVTPGDGSEAPRDESTAHRDGPATQKPDPTASQDEPAASQCDPAARRRGSRDCREHTAAGPEHNAAREDMAVASLFGGLALANAGLGAVHGLAGPLGGMIRAPHGAICAALLPHVVAANLHALRARDPASPALPRYDEVARLLTGKVDAAADDAIEWLRELVADLGIPRLGVFGLKPSQISELVDKAKAASSMKANPIELTPDELASIVAAAL